MTNITANYPTAQQLIAANPMLGVIARRIVRLWHSGKADESGREYRAAIANYGADVKGALDTVIGFMCLWEA